MGAGTGKGKLQAANEGGPITTSYLPRMRGWTVIRPFNEAVSVDDSAKVGTAEYVGPSNKGQRNHSK